MGNSISVKKLGVKGRPKKKTFANNSSLGKVLTSTVFEIQMFGVTGDS